MSRSRTRRPRAAARLLWTLAGFAPLAGLGAQTPTPAGSAVCPPPGTLPLPNDTVRATLHLWVDSAATVPARARGLAEAALQELAALFPTPSTLSIQPVLMVVYDDPRSRGTPGPSLDARVDFVLRRDGTMRAVKLARKADAAELNSGLLRAVTLSDSTRLLAALPNMVERDSVLVGIRLGPVPAASAAALPLLRAVVPYIRADRPVRPLKSVPPRYPDAARRQNIEERILVQFVVTDSGRADMSTLRFLRGTYREFGDAVLKALPKYTFAPARVGGCPVPQRVQLPFEFRIGH